MEYSKDIISRLLDIYERRSGYAKRAEDLRSIQFEVSKEYPVYKDRYDNEKYRDINTAIEKNIAAGLIFAEKDQTGRYSKIKLNIEKVDDCYALLKRSSIPDQCKKVFQMIPFTNFFKISQRIFANSYCFYGYFVLIYIKDIR